MKVLLLFVGISIICAVSASLFDVFGKGTASGTFKYNNAECKWYEKRETRSVRSLNIDCGGFKTSYGGDPHKCKWYMKGNAKAYYECLNSALVKAKFDANSPSEIACEKHGCGDVEFRRLRYEVKQLRMKTTIVEEEFFDTE